MNKYLLQNTSVSARTNKSSSPRNLPAALTLALLACLSCGPVLATPVTEEPLGSWSGAESEETRPATGLYCWRHEDDNSGALRCSDMTPNRYPEHRPIEAQQISLSGPQVDKSYYEERMRQARHLHEIYPREQDLMWAGDKEILRLDAEIKEAKRQWEFSQAGRSFNTRPGKWEIVAEKKIQELEQKREETWQQNLKNLGLYRSYQKKMAQEAAADS